MNKLRVQINSNPQKWLSRLGLGLIIFVQSLQTGVGQFNYIPDIIKIEVRESSPPSLALAEANAEYIDNSISANISATPLKVGLALLPQLELEEILINELDQVDTQFFNKNGVIITTDNIKADNSEIVYPENLSGEQLSRLKVAQEKYRVLDQVWSQPQYAEESMGDKVRRFDQKAREEDLFDRAKTKVIVRDDNLINSNNLGRISLGANNLVAGTLAKNPQASVTVEGLIEFARKADLALTPEHHIEVRRFVEGVPQEFGIVRLPEATFNIQFQDTSGSIVAQLINADGIVEGQGTLAVQDLIKNKNLHPILLIKPATKSNIQFASAYGPSFQKDFQTNLNFDIFGSLDYHQRLTKDNYFANSYMDSEVVVQASVENHFGTTTIISLADGADIMLLPDKMINGLADILSEQEISLNLQNGDSLIWGQVRRDGKPIEGATVLAERVDPIYFGGMQLPDQLRTATSNNGMFVIVVNEPGWKDLFIQLGDGAKLHLNVLTFPGKVAQVFADLPSREILASVKSYDAFSGEPKRAKVQIQQVEDTIDTGEKGESEVNIPVTQSLSFISVFPEAPYMDAKFSYTKVVDFVHLPMIRREWLEQIARYIRINPDSNKGIVVGFVQNANYDLVASSPEQTKGNLVYFNNNGEVVNSGVKGGGFILFNQPLSFVGITLEDQKNGRMFHKITSPEAKFISILNFML